MHTCIRIAGQLNLVANTSSPVDVHTDDVVVTGDETVATKLQSLLDMLYQVKQVFACDG